MAQTDVQVAILGAGPYGLAAAAHLRVARVEPVVFGEPMEFWKQNMPAGMLLRSAWEASHIADPRRELTLEAFGRDRGRPLAPPVALSDFIAYGEWFQRHVAPEVDRRRVAAVERVNGLLALELTDGEALLAKRVVVSAGLFPFGTRPAPFDALPDELASHSSARIGFEDLAGRKVLVIGSGQSALESAALLHEQGSDVELVARAPVVHYLRGAWLKAHLGPLRPLVYPDTDVGPPGLNLIVSKPPVFRRFPLSWQGRMARRSIRPAGASWLVPRLAGVTLTLSHKVVSAEPENGGVRVTLDDGSRRDVDHVLTATGYRVDVGKYAFLRPSTVAGLTLRGGYPLLRSGFESSIDGLHFLGAPAAESFGPLMRFVSGTGFAGRALARRVAQG